MCKIKYQAPDDYHLQGHFVVIFDDGHEETADNYDEAMEIARQDQ